VDYDNVRFHLSTPSSKTQLLLSMGIQCWPDLVKYGAREHLQQEYGGYLLGEGETEPEYNVSLMIDLEKLPAMSGESSMPFTVIFDLCCLFRVVPKIVSFDTLVYLGCPGTS
jgi:hypothetical protein